MGENINNKIGLVLEGGGMRGMYTAGVLDLFIEENIWPDGIIGVSAGAIHGSSYLANQHGRSVRYNIKYINDKRYTSFKSWITTGDIFNADFCYNRIPNELNLFDYDTFKEKAADIPFYVGCSNLETGEPEYIRCTDFRKDTKYMQASASLPLVSKIVEVNNQKLLDGASTDSIPVKYFRSIGFNKNIVILTRPKGYTKKPDKSIGVLKKIYGKYPQYIKACANRHKLYNHTIKYIEFLEQKGEVLVIRPSKAIKIGRLEKDTDKLKYMYRLGRHDAKCMLQDIKAFMK